MLKPSHNCQSLSVILKPNRSDPGTVRGADSLTPLSRSGPARLNKPPRVQHSWPFHVGQVAHLPHTPKSMIYLANQKKYTKVTYCLMQCSSFLFRFISAELLYSCNAIKSLTFGTAQTTVSLLLLSVITHVCEIWCVRRYFFALRCKQTFFSSIRFTWLSLSYICV